MSAVARLFNAYSTTKAAEKYNENEQATKEKHGAVNSVEVPYTTATIAETVSVSTPQGCGLLFSASSVYVRVLAGRCTALCLAGFCLP